MSVFGPFPTTEAAQQPRSGLLELPPELRNRIYEVTFTDEVGLVHKPSTVDTDARCLIATPGILLTCQQIYKDSVERRLHHEVFHLPPNVGEKPIQRVPRSHQPTSTSTLQRF